MITMGTKQRIIIGHFNDGKSCRALARELHLNRRTVQKYIDEHQRFLARPAPVGSVAERGVVDAPRYDVSRRVKTALTPEVRVLLNGYLELNARHRAAGRAKQQMKMTDMHEQVLLAGHRIGYTTVCRYVQTRRAAWGGGEAFIRQQPPPGSEVEFDWGEVKLVIAGQQKRLMLAVFTSAFSNHRFALLYYRQDMSSFLAAHVAYFSHCAHVAARLVYDNMRVAVARFCVRDGKSDKQPTEDLLRLSSYYGFDFRFCNVRRGNEKGHVERSVEYVRRKSFSHQIDFEDLQSANAHLLRCCEQLNERSVHGQQRTIAQRYAEECAVMKRAPTAALDTGVVMHKRVDKYSCISVDTNHYSVPDDRVGQVVELRLYALHLEVYDPHHATLIARHHRRHTKYAYYVEWSHYLSTLRRKPGALLGSLAWQQAEDWLRQFYQEYFDARRVGDLLDLLNWCSQNRISTERLRQAVRELQRGRAHLPLDVDHLKVVLTRREPVHDPVTEPNSAQSQTIRQRAKAQLEKYHTLF